MIQKHVSTSSVDDLHRIGPTETLISFLLRSPLVGSELDIPYSDIAYAFPNLLDDED